MKPLMMCGHRSNAHYYKDGEIRPVCISCLGEKTNKAMIVDERGLEGRIAECAFCGTVADSGFDLKFFKKGNPDTYYCGCRD